MIEDKAEKFILTNAIPYEGVQFPNEGLIRYLKSKDIQIQENYKLLRYHHKVNREAKSLEMLATFYVRADKHCEQISKQLKEDQNKNGTALIKEYSELIKKKIMAGPEVFAWEGDDLIDVSK